MTRATRSAALLSVGLLVLVAATSAAVAATDRPVGTPDGDDAAGPVDGHGGAVGSAPGSGNATVEATPGSGTVATDGAVSGGTGVEGHGFGIGAAVVALFGLAGLYLWRRR